MTTYYERKVAETLDSIFGDKEPELKYFAEIDMLYDNDDEKKVATESAIESIRRSNERYIKEIISIGKFFTHDVSGSLIPFDINQAFDHQNKTVG